MCVLLLRLMVACVFWGVLLGCLIIVVVLVGWFVCYVCSCVFVGCVCVVFCCLMLFVFVSVVLFFGGVVVNLVCCYFVVIILLSWFGWSLVLS